VLLQSKLFITALMMWGIKGTQQTRLQWTILATVMVAMCVYMTAGDFKNCSKSAAASGGAVDMDYILGIGMVVLKVVVSCLCAVLADKYMKEYKQDPIYMQLVRLKVSWIIATIIYSHGYDSINLLAVVAGPDGYELMPPRRRRRPAPGRHEDADRLNDHRDDNDRLFDKYHDSSDSDRHNTRHMHADSNDRSSNGNEHNYTNANDRDRHSYRHDRDRYANTHGSWDGNGAYRPNDHVHHPDEHDREDSDGHSNSHRHDDTHSTRDSTTNTPPRRSLTYHGGATADTARPRQAPDDFDNLLGALGDLLRRQTDILDDLNTLIRRARDVQTQRTQLTPSGICPPEHNDHREDPLQKHDPWRQALNTSSPRDTYGDRKRPRPLRRNKRQNQPLTRPRPPTITFTDGRTSVMTGARLLRCLENSDKLHDGYALTTTEEYALATAIATQQKKQNPDTTWPRKTLLLWDQTHDATPPTGATSTWIPTSDGYQMMWTTTLYTEGYPTPPQPHWLKEMQETQWTAPTPIGGPTTPRHPGHFTAMPPTGQPPSTNYPTDLNHATTITIDEWMPPTRPPSGTTDTSSIPPSWVTSTSDGTDDDPTPPGGDDTDDDDDSTDTSWCRPRPPL